VAPIKTKLFTAKSQNTPSDFRIRSKPGISFGTHLRQDLNAVRPKGFQRGKASSRSLRVLLCELAKTTKIHALTRSRGSLSIGSASTKCNFDQVVTLLGHL
jgi:hypothetical protein